MTTMTPPQQTPTEATQAPAETAAPTIASGNAASTVRRTPCRSMPIPANNCMPANAKW